MTVLQRFLTLPAAAFTPASLSGLIGWWDTSVTASLSLTGASINSITDQSGVGHTMNNVNATKPQYNATGFNTTKPAMVFTAASSTALQATPFAMGTGNTLTAWAVCTLGDTGTNDYGRIMAYNAPGQLDYTNAGSWTFNRNLSSTTTLMFSRSNTNLTSSSAGAAHPAGHRIILTISSAGAITIYSDNVSVLTGTLSGNWVSAGAVNIGRHGANSTFWTGPMAELGIATSFSNTTVVAQLDGYLKNKWGL